MTADIADQRRLGTRGWTLTLLVAGILIATMDILIVNIASTSIQDSIGASNGELQLILAIYSMVYSLLVITSSRLGDRHGRKRIFLLGVGLFTLGSLLCATATSPRMLIGFRVLEGVGAAAMVPQVLPTLHVLYPPEDRQWALGVYGAAIGLAAVVGQLFGGALIASDLFGLGWRLVFLVNVPIGIAIVIAGLRLIGDSRDPHPKRLDLKGVLVLTAALVLFTSPLVAAGRAHWEPWMIGSLVASMIVGVAFMRLEQSVAHRGGNPLVHADLFRSPGYAPGLTALALAQCGASAFMFVYVLHMQLGMGFSPLAVAASLGLPAIGYVLASLTTGPLVKRWRGHVAVLGGGLIVLGYVGVLFLVAAERTALTPMAIFAPYLVSAVGRGLMFTPTINLAFSRVGTEQLGMASGVLNTSFHLASLLGVVAIGSLFFAVRDLAPGTLSNRSLVAFFACLAAILAIATLALGCLWGTQRASVRAAPLANALRTVSAGPKPVE